MKPHKHAELIKAWADGAEIEWCGGGNGIWFTVHSPIWDDAGDFRIKPEKKWYRVGEFANGTVTADDENEERTYSQMENFKRWITDRIYYE